MRLRVQHQSLYRYDRPVRGVVQSQRLMPSVFDGQRVMAWSVTVTNGIAGGSFRDGAGDRVQGYSVPGPVQQIEVTVEGEVETTDLAGVLRGHRESVVPEVYLRETPATRPDAALSELAASVRGAGPLDLAHALSAAVSDAIAYRPGVTSAHTTAAEALAQAEGVCQDHAHAMIALSRLRGMPARYVTGYLCTPSGAAGRVVAGTAARAADGKRATQAARATHEAAHAWAEVWIARLGWVGFDAANRCCPDARYIRMGSGLDAREAAPIRGIARSEAQEDLQVRVAIDVAAQQ
jgi:transglutaminase-like putative cysteine protease